MSINSSFNNFLDNAQFLFNRNSREKSLCTVIKDIPIEAGRESLERYADKTIPYIWRYGAKINSENGEDGILYHIFSAIGTTNKTTVEICAGDDIVCNSANLILHHGFKGYLLDGNEQSINNGVQFNAECAKKDPSLGLRVHFPRHG